jgi:NAD(P)-dependent dehydrogenase (short-subunit alcohol dehydrogenase family)
MAPLAGKKVLIIGGTSGIGFGVAKAALAEGAHVIVASSDVTKVEAAVQRLGNGERAQGHTVDVSSEESVDALFAKIGKVEHLVFTVSICAQVGMSRLIGLCRLAARFPEGCLRCSRTSR